jgi:D-3-phosphoglycerate dehydrogenase
LAPLNKNIYKSGEGYSENMKVLLASNIHPAAVEMLKKKVEVAEAAGASPEDLIEMISDADGVMVRSKPKLTKDVLEHAKKLKVIGRAGVGVDNIDIDYATKRGVIVVNAPEASTATVAEHAFGMILGLARKIPQAVANMKSGRWDKKKFMGIELRGKTLGVIGIGRIGSRVAEIGKAFGMEVIAYDPYISAEMAAKKGIDLQDFNELLARSDFVTLHIPRTEKTAGLIGEKALKIMKPTAYIVSCARGGIVDETALYNALKAGTIAGAALDVFEKEPPEGSPLLGLENIVTTPHLGASTQEAQENASVTAAKDVLAVLTNDTPKNAVNMPVIAPETLERLNPYLTLSEDIGRLAIQLASGRVEGIDVVYCGKLREVEELSLLTNTILKSVLAPILLNTINIVNSEIIAKDRGIKVVQGESEDAEDFASMIIVTLKTDSESLELKGVLFGDLHPKIVGIDGYDLELVPSGNILIIRNEDRPGIIGNIATTIGHHGINIGAMQVGRKNVGEAQIMALTIDQEVSEETLTSLSLIEGVLSVRMTKN